MKIRFFNEADTMSVSTIKHS